MFELALMHVNQAEREREVESDLRRRQLLDGSDRRDLPGRMPRITIPSLRRAASPVQAADR
jgi:hypothetical protein